MFRFVFLCIYLFMGEQYVAGSVSETDYLRQTAAWQRLQETGQYCHQAGYEWASRTSSCYKFHKDSKSWYRALQACHSEGGHLAIINSQTESQVLKEIFGKHHNDVTGATNRDFASIGIWKLNDVDSKWVTIHGQTIEEAGFTEWHTGEPNNFENHEYCGGIYPDGLLNDLHCSNGNQFPFICEATP